MRSTCAYRFGEANARPSDSTTRALLAGVVENDTVAARGVTLSTTGPRASAIATATASSIIQRKTPAGATRFQPSSRTAFVIVTSSEGGPSVTARALIASIVASEASS